MEDASDLCSMLVATGRLVPASKWVTSIAEKLEQEAMDNILDGMMG